MECSTTDRELFTKIRHDIIHEGLLQSFTDDLNSILESLSTAQIGKPPIDERMKQAAMKFGKAVLSRAFGYYSKKYPTAKKGAVVQFVDCVINKLVSEAISPIASRSPYDSWAHGINLVYNDLHNYADSWIESNWSTSVISDKNQQPMSGHLISEDVSFIQNSSLNTIANRDIKELSSAIQSRSFKTTLILSGSLLECMLLDALLQRTEEAQKFNPPKGDLAKWDLSDLIIAAEKLSIISSSVQEKLSQILREYRNLVHPGKELRDKYVIAREDATIAVETVNIIMKDLISKGADINSH